MCGTVVQLDLVAGDTVGLFNLFYSSKAEIAALSFFLVDEFGFGVTILEASSPIELDGLELATTSDNQVSGRESECLDAFNIQRVT